MVGVQNRVPEPGNTITKNNCRMVQGPEKVDLRASHVLDADVLLLIFGQIQPHTLDYVPAISLYITTYHHITTDYS